jgi:hypothetical protein
MENEPTPEQRVAYKEWLLADEAAMNARDAVLESIQGSDSLIDLDVVEQLSARANELRLQADQMLQRALAAVHRHDQEATQAGQCTGTRFASKIRTIVDMEVHEISRRSYERHEEPIESQH